MARCPVCRGAWDALDRFALLGRVAVSPSGVAVLGERQAALLAYVIAARSLVSAQELDAHFWPAGAAAAGCRRNVVKHINSALRPLGWKLGAVHGTYKRPWIGFFEILRDEDGRLRAASSGPGERAC